MTLGVLNNLSAIYAENNLNNTSNSLQTVLQQLSSGSKINSGADDSAGLSLVNGLQANSTALTQSKTNAQEGVGLLQVADGALLQVTNLLNRAITLATEASNGTLNSSQEAAANQEYSTILSEINNIGSTTTYNQERVFSGNVISIYTGDSSTAGSSIDNLYMRTLSESSVGDTQGQMTYSNGQNNVFVNLSTSTQNAQATDTLNASGTTTVQIQYLVKGAGGTNSTATTSISVGTGTSFANTVNGLISAINSAGLGLSATFTTQAGAGITGGGTQTGIEISGGLISAGVDPSSVSTSGTLNASGLLSTEDLTQGQVLTVKVGTTTAASITINSSTSTLTSLAAAINTAATNVNGSSTFVTATVVTNGDGTQSLQLNDSTSTGGVLSVTTQSGGTPVHSLATTASSANPTAMSVGAKVTGVLGTDAQTTISMSDGYNSPTGAMTGSIVLANGGSGNVTFVMNGGGVANGTTIFNGGTDLTTLAAAINSATTANSAFAMSAIVNANGIVLTSTSAGTTIQQVGSNTLTATPTMNVAYNVAGQPATGGTTGTTTISLASGDNYNTTDILKTGTSIVLQNGNYGTPGNAYTFVIGGVSSGNVIGVPKAGANYEVSDLLTAINGSGLNATANVVGGQIVLTAAAVGTTISMGSSTNLVDVNYNPSAGVATLYTGPTAGVVGTGSEITTTVANSSINVNQNGDTLTGSLTLVNNGYTETFVMGSSGSMVDTGNGTVTTAADSLSSLLTAINSFSGAGNLGVTAALTANGTGSGLAFSTTIDGNIHVTSHLSDAYTISATTPASGGNPQYSSVLIANSDNGKSGAGDVLSGSVVIGNGTNTDTFVIGNSGAASASGGNTITTANATLASLLAAINNEGAAGTKLGANTMNWSATQDSDTDGIFLQGTNKVATGEVLTVTPTLTDTYGETAVTSVNGHAPTAAIPSSLVVSNGSINNGSDPLTGSITMADGAGTTYTFVMGGTTTGTTIGVATQTLDGLKNAINAAEVTNNIGLTATDTGTSGLTITSVDNGTVAATSFLTDLYQPSSSPTIVAGTSAAAATYASSTVQVGNNGNVGSDVITGSIVLANSGGGGGTQTFVMGTGAGDIGGSSLTDLAQAISNSTLGLQASVSNGALVLHSTLADTTIVFGNGSGATALNDTSLANAVTSNTGVTPTYASTNLTTGGTTVGTGNILTGSFAVTNNGHTVTFVMGSSANNGLGQSYLSDSTAGTILVNGNTVADLEASIAGSNTLTGLDITATQTGSNILLTSTVGTTTTIGISSNSLQDDFNIAASSGSLGSFAASTDVLSGSLSFTVGGVQESLALGSSTTVADMVRLVNAGSYGVSATLSSPDSNGFVSVTLTSETYGSSGNVVDTGTALTDTTTTAELTWYQASAYNTGITNSTVASDTAVYDSSSGQSNTDDGIATFTSNSNGSSGTATIGYSDGAGVSLSATSLLSQSYAQSALTLLNSAVTDVAAMDGYIGAQINTLNSVSQVLTTQQENVLSAQNAIQATDYASATANMSKYEILSQTGIAALAQANTVQQEVTKLLQ